MFKLGNLSWFPFQSIIGKGKIFLRFLFLKKFVILVFNCPALLCWDANRRSVGCSQLQTPLLPSSYLEAGLFTSLWSNRKFWNMLLYVWRSNIYIISYNIEQINSSSLGTMKSIICHSSQVTASHHQSPGIRT